MKTKTPKKTENEVIDEINANKKGKYIHIKCWTPRYQSSSETHAKSLTAAIKELKKSAQFHSNWKLEFISE